MAYKIGVMAYDAAQHFVKSLIVAWVGAGCDFRATFLD